MIWRNHTSGSAEPKPRERHLPEQHFQKVREAAVSGIGFGTTRQSSSLEATMSLAAY